MLIPYNTNRVNIISYLFCKICRCQLFMRYQQRQKCLRCLWSPLELTLNDISTESIIVNKAYSAAFVSESKIFLQQTHNYTTTPASQTSAHRPAHALLTQYDNILDCVDMPDVGIFLSRNLYYCKAKGQWRLF